MNDERRVFIQAAIIIAAVVFAVRLFSIQILDSTYKLAAENNIVQKVTEYPYRGLLHDRNGELLVFNTPIYDLMVVPQEVSLSDTAIFCQMVGITSQDFEAKMGDAGKYSSILPSKFIELLTNEQFATIQDRLVEYPGFHIRARTTRKYQYNSLANALGYIGEISRKQLEMDTTKFYKSGDFVGISGLEAAYEEELRGQRGVSYKMVNVRGVEKGMFKDGAYDTLSQPGRDLVLTIDLDLQTYAEKLINGKTGSVVAIEPSTGEILTLVSSPSYWSWFVIDHFVASLRKLRSLDFGIIR